ncbi:cytochrome c oxidase assembly protein subunit 11 [Pseudomonas sp. PvR086]|jgi:cytochrome c oxidase assembly protein subunit 11|uniref:Cytochrome c oxidase assembly protein subunit 11 n=2 Tax=Pseudomonas TaxID=286 RepID=A0ACC5MNY0_9PSED|nr:MULTISPECIES: cytochrome c oxidase assembly protein [Pseudomonas]ANI57648.1 cysteine synthase [Pseudomonas sp. GR 6-02]ATE80386.1 cytochrome c oxidase assembly protein [Pseudomonas frederiksbergensis]MBB2889760.1 cytochrome c oxidase assembly protein subunit 11 [Pseudomonas umsongensis]MBD9608646.1 cytochrome c oxidase assembly protein [Pseudomonas sp. PDM08]MDR7108514.1 cytochrome c oxidase assembly protein subunit 11 [Pseudomonas frederiksbergensis]
MADSISMKKLVTRLLLVVAAMFVFGFALVPIYDVMCKAFGINGKTAGQYEGEQTVDASRQVRVQFLSTNAADMPWDFYPKTDELTAHPGAVNEMIFIAHNPTDRPMSAQAVPSIAPSAAAAYFHKTECFCFTQQVLQPGQRIEMPVRFIVDRDMPKDVKHLTLSYTLFDITARHPPVAVAASTGG